MKFQSKINNDIKIKYIFNERFNLWLRQCMKNLIPWLSGKDIWHVKDELDGKE